MAIPGPPSDDEPGLRRPCPASPDATRVATSRYTGQDLNRCGQRQGRGLARYPDRYTQKLTQVIAAKVAGQEIVAPPPGQIPEVINLMEALKKSVARVQQSTKKDTAKPALKAGGSRRATPARQIS